MRALAAQLEADPGVRRARAAWDEAAARARLDLPLAPPGADRVDRERAWKLRAREGAPLAAPLIELIRMRNAAALGVGAASAHDVYLAALGIDGDWLERILDEIDQATDDLWSNALAARRARLAVARLAPWDLFERAAPSDAPLRELLADAAARLGFDLEGIAIEEGAPAATIVDARGVTLRARREAPREALHELGHALHAAHAGGARDARGPLHEGIAEWVASLAPRTEWQVLVELRHALLRTALERELYRDDEDPAVVYRQLARRFTHVDTDEETAVWARLRHLALHPGHLACYPVGAVIAARLARAAPDPPHAWLRSIFTAGASRPWREVVRDAVRSGGGERPLGPTETRLLALELGPGSTG